MSENNSKSFTPLSAILTAFCIMISIATSITSAYFFVPFLWNTFVEAAQVTWSIFIYWSKASHYIGAVVCFLTVWAQATIFLLNFDDTYLKQRRRGIAIMVILAAINALFLFANMETTSFSERADISLFSFAYVLTVLASALIAYAIAINFWDEKPVKNEETSA